MRRSVKTESTAVTDFADFSGGLNLRTSPENIELNELAECINMTYGSQPGRLCTRPGLGSPLHTFDADVNGLYWFKDYLFIAAGQKLYRMDSSEAINETGDLTGTGRPDFVEFGDDLYIASGGKLQKYDYDNDKLVTIDDSPAALVGIYARAGRLYGWETGSDTLRGCAVGDPSIWTVPSTATDADPVDLQVGYKVAGSIMCCVPSLSDVIVFKDKATFRISGEYPDWTIKEISRDEAVANKDSAVNVGGYLFYIEKTKGIRLLQPTDSYSSVMPTDVLQRVNPWIRAHIDAEKVRLFNLPGRNILMFSDGGTLLLPSYYEYGLSTMPSLEWVMPDDVGDICEPDRVHLYIACGTSVYDLSGASWYDPTGTDGALEPIKCSFSSKLFVSFSAYELKRISINARALGSVTDESPVSIKVNDTEYETLVFTHDESPYVYANAEVVNESQFEFGNIFEEQVDFSTHNLFRSQRLQIKFEGHSTPFELGRFSVETYRVGVIS